MSAVAAESDAGRTAGVNANVVLALVAVAQFMVVLDASIVNVALPTIKRDVGFSEQSLSWILNAYTLIFGGFLLLGGRLADRLGRRRLFMAGIALFSVASLVCGVSQSEGDAARRPRIPGAGRGDGVAGCALDHPDDVRRRTGAQSRAVGLGGDRGCRRRRRPAARRRDRAAAQLALGVLRQRADRRRGARAGAADHPGEPLGVGREQRLRRRGRGRDHARDDGAGVHADQGRQLGLDVGADHRRLRRRGGAGCRVHRDRAPSGGSAGAAADLLQPQPFRRGRDAARDRWPRCSGCSSS